MVYQLTFVTAMDRALSQNVSRVTTLFNTRMRGMGLIYPAS